MTWTEAAGAVLWGGFAAGTFLWWLQRELVRCAASAGRGYRLRSAVRVLATAAALALAGLVNSGLVPLAMVGFVGTRSILVWRMGGCRGH